MVLRAAGRGEGGYSFVACLSHLTIDHASFSRRSTVPTPNIDTSNIMLFPYITYCRNFLPILSPSRLAACGHRPSPRIAIIFSLLSSVSNSGGCVKYLFDAFRQKHASSTREGERDTINTMTLSGRGGGLPRRRH